jgi:hypothetical protein
MRSIIVKIIAVLVLFLGITVGSYITLLNMVSPEFDMVSQVSGIVDGDTFDIASGDRIRLADIDTPEQWASGYEQASNFLEQIIYDETVYLDVDDINRWDSTGNKLACVAYVNYNLTHYMNVNKALLEMDYAVVWENDNEFNPATWNLYISKVSPESRRNLMFVSAALGILSTLFIVLAFRRGYRTGKQMVDRVSSWAQGTINRGKKQSEGISETERAFEPHPPHWKYLKEGNCFVRYRVA